MYNLFFLLISLFYFLIFPILVGVYAQKKGLSFFGYFLLSILITPIISFLIALLSNEKKPEDVIKKENHEKKVKEFVEAKMLFEEGIISEEDFNRKKNALKPRAKVTVTGKNNEEILNSLNDDDEILIKNKKMGYNEYVKVSFFNKMIKEYGADKFIFLGFKEQ